MSLNNITKFKVQCSQTNIPDLKTLEKNSKLTEQDIEFQYNPFNVTSIQCYNPIYADFIESDSIDNISLNNQFHIIDLTTVIDPVTEEIYDKPVFIKFSPLLDPLRYMIGKYNINESKTIELPVLNCDETRHLTKLTSKNNASYVDNFFCFLTNKILEKHGFIHGLEYYGSFLGIQEKYKMNVIDDLEYLQNSTFFMENVGKHFKLTDNDSESYFGNGSRGNKPKLTIPVDTNNDNNISTVDLDDVVDLGDVEDIKVSENIDSIGVEEVYEKKNKTNHTSTSSSDDSSNNSETNYSSDEENIDNSDDENDEEWDTESENDEEESDKEEEEAIYSYIDNFPIQMICLEKCHGTLDELFMKHKITDKNGASILFQIIMILLTYQKKFNFTHNDLHTNNIMFKNTDIKFLYYKYDGKTYKVPTYGRIFKLIDFGRSIYKFQNKLYCSDSFFTGGDAATQYNFEPFMNNNKPRLEPNYSFDLCRLGTSIYDFIIENDHKPNQLDELQKTILRWCKDDNDKNILYKRDGSERYPGFRLYKMISRTVHNHTPEEQLKFPFFNKFELVYGDNVEDKEEGSLVLDIDSIPVYSI
jgi:hypothetical protein